MTKRLWTTACLLSAMLAAGAQGAFDPTNPPEPEAPVENYTLTLTASHSGAARTLTGGGTYTAGTRIYVRTTGNTGYTFQRWEKDGTTVSTTASFYYTMPAEDVTLTAVYTYLYNPANPSEPSTPISSYPLYLVAQPAKGGTFNRTSGTKTAVGTKLTITATPATGYVFEGWYDEAGALLSSNKKLSNYVMPAAATTLTARFIYSPTSPGDPTGNQDQVDNVLMPGDANGDGRVTVTDIGVVTNKILERPVADYHELGADANGDGKVTVTDIGTIVDMILGTASPAPTGSPKGEGETVNGCKL